MDIYNKLLTSNVHRFQNKQVQGFKQQLKRAPQLFIYTETTAKVLFAFNSLHFFYYCNKKRQINSFKKKKKDLNLLCF